MSWLLEPDTTTRACYVKGIMPLGWTEQNRNTMGGAEPARAPVHCRAGRKPHESPMPDDAEPHISRRDLRAAHKAARDGAWNEGPPGSLEEIAAGVGLCRRCELWRGATQGVPGQGPARATLMLVGEQPGDQEDLAGAPFVGPAGRVLDAGLARAGVPRAEIFVTNAVKHFKHELRGKRRLHKTPDVGEVQACRWWLAAERR